MLALLDPRGPALDGQIMLRSVVYALLCLLVVASRGGAKSGGGGDHEWSYDEEEKKTGPDHWSALFNKCGGSQQSPIDINTKELDPSEDLDEIDFENYDDELENAKIENNGHTVVVKPGDKDPTLMISDGGLDDDFKLIEIHFHWGSDSKRGSEHTINGKQYPMEMHLVHQNTKYKSKDAALGKEDGLAVLGVLFKIDDEDNDNFKPIIDKLDDIINEGQSAELDDFEVEDLLPDERMPYYRYEGSLTTPPCNEVVIWTIFADFVPISEEQMGAFRNLKEKEPGETEPEKLVNNFRKTQPLHTRVIEVSAGSARNTPVSASMTLGLAALAAAFTFFRRV